MHPIDSPVCTGVSVASSYESKNDQCWINVKFPTLRWVNVGITFLQHVIESSFEIITRYMDLILHPTLFSEHFPSGSLGTLHFEVCYRLSLLSFDNRGVGTCFDVEIVFTVHEVVYWALIWHSLVYFGLSWPKLLMTRDVNYVISVNTAC